MDLLSITVGFVLGLVFGIYLGVTLLLEHQKSTKKI